MVCVLILDYFYHFLIPVLQVALREAHEEAVQKSLATFNASAVGVGSVRKKYEELLQKFFRKEFEVTVS
jgi:hypothetical protein